MMIERLGGLDPLKNVQSSQKMVNKAPVKMGEDTVSVSAEAKEMAEAYYLTEVASSTPDVRSDLVSQIKEKIKDPSYINNAVISSTADKFMESIGL
ncbi:MAG TPA: flagellar biosynthesis anti-sigma factor FlgM [Treponemataceae bacterium]|jgi:anti-sigma28 factor (negative regulator of flagellin synthesis)|nr:flagellar biosynthesis anti-sigma factor FlgM [Treponemataceae bacterium]